MNRKELEKYIVEINKLKIMCKCGHKVVMLPKYKSNICSWCGNKIDNPREVFKNNLLNLLK
jgi:DNA-directed RNA polymerase subunit RPC12/RpoP